MPMKKYKPEQIVTLLRQVEVELANGKTTPQACKEAEITAQTYYRWRKEFGGLKLDQAKRLKELERENAKPWRLRKNGKDLKSSCSFIGRPSISMLYLNKCRLEMQIAGRLQMVVKAARSLKTYETSRR